MIATLRVVAIRPGVEFTMKLKFNRAIALDREKHKYKLIMGAQLNIDEIAFIVRLGHL